VIEAMIVESPFDVNEVILASMDILNDLPYRVIVISFGGKQMLELCHGSFVALFEIKMPSCR